ncbi:sulfatase-like hydrolase/transferase [Roseibacillus ishigakijimensis]|uniref:Sulfatase-like hydrolase/transferase n=1 Tax=Roseibacillus ishigakijimensis TaxID=454146 RepID=A0A934RKV7_9BACT|nr:sulfatase-like hydrolase/transferase [Roseibacillus ishigakijimensis]MBK1833279.1 sulfatase-like hydrolase/transferase [Roseibacillus ishigakijimensis]
MKIAFLSSLLGLALLCPFATGAPNIVFILMDDFGYNDVGAQTYPAPPNQYPHSGPTPVPLANSGPIPEPNVAFGLTPRIDSLAADGMRLTQFYSSPACSPSRASFMTGRYDRRISTNKVFFSNHGDGLNTSEVTVPEVLRETGYLTAMVGKWHLGYNPGRHNPFQMGPLRHGFHHFLGFPHSNDIANHDLIRDEEVLIRDFSSPSQQAEITWRYTEAALEYIEDFSAQEKPFFLYLAHTMTHQPCWPSDREFTNADGSTWPVFLGSSGVSNYYDVVAEVDHSVGRILDKLTALGLEEETIVIFASDNGPWLRLSNRNLTDRSVGSAYPLRGNKAQTWEGGCRVPFFVRWPGVIPAGSVRDDTTGLIDLLPTFTALAGGDLPSDRTIDGVDLSALWRGEGGAERQSYALFNTSNDGLGSLSAIIKDDWKLRDGKLYNLAEDIQESVDLASSQRRQLAEMEREMTAVSDSIAAESAPRGEFTSYEVLLSANELEVPEGGEASLEVSLSADPGKAVLVTTAPFSGDGDLSVAAGGVLTFDSTNWALPRTVTLAAAVDEDDEGSGATFRVTTDDIAPVREVFVFEKDAEAVDPVELSLLWPKASPVCLAGTTTGLVAEGAAQVGEGLDPAGTSYQWSQISGPAAASFTHVTEARTGVRFPVEGPYRLRLTASHPEAGGAAAVDFRVEVGEWREEEEGVSYKFAPLFAHNASSDEDGNAVWEEAVGPGGREWSLAESVTRSSGDPAPDLAFIEAAYQFPGGTNRPAGGLSNHLDAFSQDDASIELWFRPQSLPVAVPQVLWESGGEVGASFVLEGNSFKFAVDNQSTGAVAEGVLAPAAERNGYLHAVGVIDLAGDEIRLYLDGVLVSSQAIPAVEDWCGTSDSGLGTIAHSSQGETTDRTHLGAYLLQPAGVELFAGEVAHFAFYGRTLAGDEIEELLSGPVGEEVVTGISGDFKREPELAYDAAQDGGEDLVWENEQPPGGRDWTLAESVILSSADPAPQLDFIEKAFQFSGSTTLPSGAVSTHLDAYSTGDASIELWFQPASLPVATPQVLWEAGGAIGAALILEENLLKFAVADNSQGAVAEAVLAPAASQDGFVHVVAVIDLPGDEVRLYLDGSLMDSEALPAALGDWCGTSHTGLGTLAHSNGAETANITHLGGYQLLPGGVRPFAGQIAYCLFYDEALTAEDVAALATGPREMSPGEAAKNLAPLVFAGAAPDARQGEEAALRGEASDDGLPEGSTLATQWRFLSGPAPVVWHDSSLPDSGVTFELEGNYVLWLEADDGVVRVYDELALSVTGLGYQAWIEGYSLSENGRDFTADPDGDGLPNGLEALFGTDPTQKTPGLALQATEGLVTVLTHPRLPGGAVDVSGTWMWSPDLQNWYLADGQAGQEEVGATLVVSSTLEAAEERAEMTASGELKQLFLRLVAVLEP